MWFAHEMHSKLHMSIMCRWLVRSGFEENTIVGPWANLALSMALATIVSAVCTMHILGAGRSERPPCFLSCYVVVGFLTDLAWLTGCLHKV